MTGLLFVCFGAAIGAPTRYLVDRAIQSRHDALMPWGTMSVNVVGSLILGVLTGLAVNHEVPREVMLALGTGLCGALTTYSTFGYETIRLAEDGARMFSGLNMALTLILGLGAALAGYGIGIAL